MTDPRTTDEDRPDQELPADESDVDYDSDPFEILADREIRAGVPLYWQTNRREPMRS